MNAIEQRLAAHGFVRTGLGGNTVGYVRCDGQIYEQLSHGDLWAIDSLDDVVTVSTLEVVGPGNEVIWELDEPSTATVRDVLAALDNPSDEYTLLDLRLYNGFHE